MTIPVLHVYEPDYTDTEADYRGAPEIAPTMCSACDQVHGDTRKEDRPWEWRCLAVPVRPGFGFVSAEYSPSPPYARCSDTNRDGRCPYFKPRRIAPEEQPA